MVAGARLYFEKPEFATATEAAAASLLDYVWDIPKAFFLTITLIERLVIRWQPLAAT